MDHPRVSVKIRGDHIIVKTLITKPPLKQYAVEVFKENSIRETHLLDWNSFWEGDNFKERKCTGWYHDPTYFPHTLNPVDYIFWYEDIGIIETGRYDHIFYIENYFYKNFVPIIDRIPN